jgi:hypothetical protein
MSRYRGQTTLDFALGMSVFLGVLIFAFGFMPAMFAPFENDTGAGFVTADRAADRLSADILTDTPREPSVLDDGCTVEFFDADGSAPATCRFDSDAANLSAALGLGDTARTNVTIRDGSGIRTLGGVRLAVGPVPTTANDPVVARRSVLLADAQHRLFVRVW